MAPTKTGAIRQQIGPMTANLIKHQQKAEDLLSKVVPQDLDSLRENIHDIQFALRNLTRTSRNLREKHDQWVAMVQDLLDEQCHYDDTCQEIIQTLLDCDDIADDLEDQIGRRETKLNSINSGTFTVPQANPPATPVVASDQTSVVQNPGLQVASGQSSTLPNPATANTVPMNAAPPRYCNVVPNNRLSEVREDLRASIIEEETTSGMLDDLQSMSQQPA